MVLTVANDLDVHLTLASPTGLCDEASDFGVLTSWAIVAELLDVDVAHDFHFPDKPSPSQDIRSELFQEQHGSFLS